MRGVTNHNEWKMSMNTREMRKPEAKERKSWIKRQDFFLSIGRLVKRLKMK